MKMSKRVKEHLNCISSGGGTNLNEMKLYFNVNQNHKLFNEKFFLNKQWQLVMFLD